jgi:hypothetical protein
MADTVLTGPTPKLPGPAAAVQYVPVCDEISDGLREANFRAVRLLNLSANAVFRHQGVPLREFLIEAMKVDSTPFDLRQAVIYQGPMREVTDDFGNTFRRGQRAVVSTPAIEALRAGPMVDSFVFLPPGDA